MPDAATQDLLRDNWRRVQQDVADAEAKYGRKPGSTTIVGVSKYVDVDTTLGLVQAGCVDLGESRPQSLWQKAESGQIPDDVRWHLIGHLQRNKVRRLLRHSAIIHSIDSERLLSSVAKESAADNKTTSVLLEVNISGDQNKTGFAIDDLPRVLQSIPTSGVRVLGLMAMAGWGTDPAEARRQFERTRQLRDRLREQSGYQLEELSMGMSGDFAEAIAEGATIVRIGSRLFEGLKIE